MSGCTRANSYAIRPTAWAIGPGSDMFTWWIDVECRVCQEKKDKGEESDRVLQDQFIGPTMNAILEGSVKLTWFKSSAHVSNTADRAK